MKTYITEEHNLVRLQYNPKFHLVPLLLEQWRCVFTPFSLSHRYLTRWSLPGAMTSYFPSLALLILTENVWVLGFNACLFHFLPLANYRCLYIVKLVLVWIVKGNNIYSTWSIWHDKRAATSAQLTIPADITLLPLDRADPITVQYMAVNTLGTFPRVKAK